MAAINQNNNPVFHGREATVEIADAIDVSDTEPIDDDANDTSQLSNGTDYSGILTEITITDPEASVEVQNTFGGQVMSESPHDLVEIEFTARFQDMEMIEEMFGSATQVDTGDFYRIDGGTTIGDRPSKAILFKVVKGDKQMNYLMNNAIFQQMGEVSLAGDGAAEITGTALCRVGDRYIENNFDATGV